MVSEISILIPVYNQSVRLLVETLLSQASQLHIPLEIRVYDDGSAPGIKHANQSVQIHPQVVYREMPANVGRSKIRYQLAQEAAFDWLLFLDNDVLPTHSSFLQNYVTQADKLVAVGGVAYQNEYPAEAILRWKYGRAREQAPAKVRQQSPFQRVFFSNLLVKKEVVLSFFSATKVQGYGHEDTLFAYTLQQKGIDVQHLDNPVYHVGVEPGAIFLKKTDQAILNLLTLQTEGFLPEESKLVKAHQMVAKCGLASVLKGSARLLLPMLRKQLLSDNPSLKVFDLYKLLVYSSWQKK